VKKIGSPVSLQVPKIVRLPSGVSVMDSTFIVLAIRTHHFDVLTAIRHGERVCWNDFVGIARVGMVA
jgi:hypothetical protein